MFPSPDPRYVADFFLAYTDRESGDTISHLKLQKLVYYAQGFGLAMRGEPLFAEMIQAWDNGPVVRSLFDAHRHNAHRAIDSPQNFEAESYLPEDRELFEAILSTYGQISASRLSEMTHGEPPWMEARARGGRNAPIAISVMRDFFSTLVESGKNGSALPPHPVWPTGSFQYQDRRKDGARMERHRVKLRSVIADREGKPGGRLDGEDD